MHGAEIKGGGENHQNMLERLILFYIYYLQKPYLSIITHRKHNIMCKWQEIEYTNILCSKLKDITAYFSLHYLHRHTIHGYKGCQLLCWIYDLVGTIDLPVKR